MPGDRARPRIIRSPHPIFEQLRQGIQKLYQFQGISDLPPPSDVIYFTSRPRGDNEVDAIRRRGEPEVDSCINPKLRRSERVTVPVRCFGTPSVSIRHQLHAEVSTLMKLMPYGDPRDSEQMRPKEGNPNMSMGDSLGISRDSNKAAPPVALKHPRSGKKNW